MFYGVRNHYWGLIIFLAAIVVLKAFATAATNGGGGCGGIFAPSLFRGCIVGFIFAHAFNYFEPMFFSKTL
jgi:CIC family chloride channel protein